MFLHFAEALTIVGGGTNQALNISAGQSLTVSNIITIGAPTGGNITKQIIVGTSTLSTGSISMASTTNTNRKCLISVSTGTVNVTGNITMAGVPVSNNFTFTGAGTLNIGGNITGGALTPFSSTVNFTGSNAQVMSDANDINFYNLNINKTSASQYGYHNQCFPGSQ